MKKITFFTPKTFFLVCERKTGEAVGEKYKKTYLELADFHVGDKVRLSESTVGISSIPRMLEGYDLKVVGFGRKNVICDFDGRKPYSIPPWILKKVEAK